MSIREETVIGRLLEVAPFATAAEARSALDATLTALRSALTDEEALALAEEIDAPWASPLRRGCFGGQLPPEEIYRVAAAHEERRLSIATEHVQVVCRVLGGLLSPEARERLIHELPLLAPELEPPEPGAPAGPERLRAPPAAEHTLAAGRPGSSRPLSDARPSPWSLADARPERAHEHSVARSDDPHHDTKLSSARGLTQEREGESLATSQRSVRR